MVAVASNDHVLALKLHRLCMTHAERLSPRDAAKLVSDKWNWTYWAAYMRRMTMDQSIPPSRIWEALGIPLYQEGSGRASAQSHRRPPGGGMTEPKVKLIERMARWFTERPNTSNRAKLRFVTQCIRHLQHHGVKPSPELLRVLTTVVTRDLAEGNYGRTSRLVWVRDLIAKHHGVDDAVRFEEAISRWRRVCGRLG
jgi:hypothetical protein